MKKLILAVVPILVFALAAPLIAGAGECNQIGNDDLRHLCKGETILIDKRDLRLVSAGDCDLVRGDDWRNVCYRRPNQIPSGDMHWLAAGNCLMIKDGDLRKLCRGWKR